MTFDLPPSTSCPVCGAAVSESQQFCGTCGSGLRGQRSRNRRRVVVTGVGAVSAVGLTALESWGNILEGKSGVKRIPYLQEGNYSCQVRGDLDLESASATISRFQDRPQYFAISVSGCWKPQAPR